MARVTRSQPAGASPGEERSLEGFRQKRREIVDPLLTEQGLEILNNETYARRPVDKIVLRLSISGCLMLNLRIQHRPVALHFDVLGCKSSL